MASSRCSRARPVRCGHVHRHDPLVGVVSGVADGGVPRVAPRQRDSYDIGAQIAEKTRGELRLAVRQVDHPDLRQRQLARRLIGRHSGSPPRFLARNGSLATTVPEPPGDAGGVLAPDRELFLLPAHAASASASMAVRARRNFAILLIGLAFCPTSGRRRRSVWRVKRRRMIHDHVRVLGCGGTRCPHTILRTTSVRKWLVEEIYSTRGESTPARPLLPCGWLVEAIGTRVSRGAGSGRDAQCRL